MIRHSPWLTLHHIGVLEAVQAAGVLEGGARGDGGGTVAGERVGVARELGAGAGVSVSSRRVSCLRFSTRYPGSLLGFKSLILHWAYTARSGVCSQQDDAGITADLILVRVSKAARPREQDADVQTPPHFLHERLTHPLEPIALGSHV
jgi:hypothetical protein